MSSSLLLGLVFLFMASLAWAEPADDLRACQAQGQILAQQVTLVRQIRDYYEARLAEALVQVEAAKAELARMKTPEEPKGPGGR